MRDGVGDSFSAVSPVESRGKDSRCWPPEILVVLYTGQIHGIRNVACKAQQALAILFDLADDVLCSDWAFEAMLKQAFGIDQ